MGPTKSLCSAQVFALANRAYAVEVFYCREPGGMYDRLSRGAVVPAHLNVYGVSESFRVSLAPF